MAMKSSFKAVAWTTALFTYLLMVWGNMVSATGSGLACPDWPLCHGSIFPPLEFDIILEWGHRLLAFTTTLLILVTAFLVWRQSQQKAHLRGVTRTILILLGAQILLGGITVMLELSVLVSTIHLTVATFVFSGIIAIAAVSQFEDRLIVSQSAKLRRLSVAALIGLLVQFILGALLRHNGAGLACPFFPSCMESFFPSAHLEQILAFTHRWWGFLLLGVFVQIVSVSKKASPQLFKWSLFIIFLVGFQILLGVGTVLSSLHTGSRGLHAATGYALWAFLFYFSLRAGALQWLWKAQNSKTT